MAWTYAYGCSFFYEPSLRVRARATGCLSAPESRDAPKVAPTNLYFVRPTKHKTLLHQELNLGEVKRPFSKTHDSLFRISLLDKSLTCI